VEHDLGIRVGDLLLDGALDDALAEVDGAGQVVLGVLALLADVHEVELLAAVEAALDVIDGAFADALLGVLHQLQESRGMVFGHDGCPPGAARSASDGVAPPRRWRSGLTGLTVLPAATP